MQRQDVGGGFGDGLVQPRHQGGAGVGGVGLQIVCGGDRFAFRQTHRGGEPAQRILVRGPNLRRGQPESVGERAEHMQSGIGRHLDRLRRRRPRVGEQCVVAPQRLAIGSPEQSDLPARQRFSRIPLALVAMDQALWRPHLLQPRRQFGCQPAFVRTVGVGGPLGVDLVVDRDERRLAAHRQADVTRGQPLVDAAAELTDGAPGGFGVRERDPGVLVDARDDVGEVQRRLTRLGRAGDGSRGLGVRRGRQRDVALTREQPRRRVQADPAGTRDVHLGPCVQIGEVGGRARRPVERLDVGRELDEVAGDEPRGQAELAQDRHEQPRRVPA